MNCFSLPTILSFNVNSFSATATSPVAIQRRNRIISFLRLQLNTHQVLLLQETHLGNNNFTFLVNELPHCTVFYSNSHNKSAGLITIIANHWLNNFYARQLEDTLDGFMLSIILYSRNEDRSTIGIHNVYIPQPTHHFTPIEVLERLATLPTVDHNILAGDWNFILDPADSTTASLPHQPLIRAWGRVTDHYSLTESYQSRHTFYRGDYSSRLDRLYHSLSEAEQALVTPETRCLRNPLGLQDHRPISTTFRDFNNPQGFCPLNHYAFEHPDFVSRFNTIWGKNQKARARTMARAKSKKMHPFKILKDFKDTIVKTTKRMAVDLTVCSPAKKAYLVKTILRTTLSHWSTKLAYKCKALHEHLRSLDQDAPEVLDYLNNRPPKRKLKPLFKYLNNLIAVHGVHAPTLLTDTPKQGSELSELKIYIPSTKQRLFSLARGDNQDPTDDPQFLHQIIKEHWGPVWHRRSDRIDPEPYLRQYTTRLRTSIPMPTEHNIRETILRTGNSSAGPDGIPFIAYKKLIHLSPGILHKCLQAIMRGSIKPPKDFNLGILYVIPKVLSHLVTDTRPITVTNTDYRILAKMIAKSLGKHLTTTLNPAQNLFLPQRKMDDNIDQVFSYYYKKQFKNKRSYLLFLDTAKAFDTIDHRFITAVTDKIQLPSWLRHYISFIMTEVEVSPILSKNSRKRLRIQRGVKQGCPLSPLLFAICFDVLLEFISSTVNKKAAADDLVIYSSRFSKIKNTMNTITQFSHYSGLGINTHKSALISTTMTSTEVRLHYEKFFRQRSISNAS